MATNASSLGVFGGLPAEIRNEIYKFALTAAEDIKITRYRQNHEELGWVSGVQRIRKIWPVARGLARNNHTITRSTNNSDLGPRSRILARRRGRDKNMPAADVFALTLLRTSKAIRAEATPILYAANHFDFETERAVETFMLLIGERAALLKHIIFSISESYESDGYRFEQFNKMAEPKSIPIRTYLRQRHDKWALTEGPLRMWQMIKTMVTTQHCYSVAGQDRLTVDLPEELQLGRFAVVTFAVEAKAQCQIGETSAFETIEDEKERGHRFKGLLKEMLVGQARRGKEDKDAQEKAVEELIGASRMMR